MAPFTHHSAVPNLLKTNAVDVDWAPVVSRSRPADKTVNSIASGPIKPIIGFISVSAPVWGEQDMENTAHTHTSQSLTCRCEKPKRHIQDFPQLPPGPDLMPVKHFWTNNVFISKTPQFRIIFIYATGYLVSHSWNMSIGYDYSKNRIYSGKAFAELPSGAELSLLTFLTQHLSKPSVYLPEDWNHLHKPSEAQTYIESSFPMQFSFSSFI